ncbi:serine/threonine-protein kinase [Nocardia testacea]|uniref:non-specific serine/threonine protein kinase n=1 Tax=Nocardia testacea TaxID=248551 RepID=A0ABW7W248_9NOCA
MNVGGAAVLGVGATFAGYRIEGVLGQGGMGTVYLARHPRLPRRVALKLLNREVSTDTELTRRFELEADVVARLEHPGIVGVFDRGTDDGHLWIAMQYIRGTDAASWDARAHPPATVVRLLGETAAALDYAHSRGVLHRDVKPANILIADAESLRESHSVLTDFGIARLTDANTRLTATGAFTATLAYGSPEQLSGAVVDHRSDQYSLACTLFAVLAGRPPYASTNPGQVVMGHISQPPPRLTASRPDLPATVDPLVARAMAKQREDRFRDCGQFVTAVRDALEGRHIAAPPATPVTPVPVARPVAARTPPEVRVGHASRPQPFPAPQRVVTDPRPPVADRPPVTDPRPPDARSWPRPPAPGPRPSRGTAVTAGVATLLVAVIPVFVFCVGLVETARMIVDADPAGRAELGYSVLALLFIGVVSLLWVSGGLLLLTGRRSGRVLTLVSSVIGVLTAIGATVAAVATSEPAVLALTGPLLLLSALAFGCAAAPATGRWLSYRTSVRAGGPRY